MLSKSSQTAPNCVDLLKDRKSLQRDLDRLDPWVKANCRSFNKVLPLCHSSPVQHCRLGKSGKEHEDTD